MVEDIEEKILALHGEQKWEDIVNLDCAINEFARCRLFWVLPTMDELRWMKKVIDEHNVVGLASIGCGCGLLEWLFKEYSGLDVIGIELDRSWWGSKYSPPLFMENMLFVREDSTANICISENHALLFCYFNNAAAFCGYIESYEGRLIFVVGPKEGEDRWTEPMPFDKKFHEYGWRLVNKREIERSNDYITVYAR